MKARDWLSSYEDKYFPSGSVRRGKVCLERRQRGALSPSPTGQLSQSLPPFLSPSPSASLPPLNPTFQLPRPPAPSWSSHKPPHLRDAIASLPFPPAHPCSTGKKNIFFLFYNTTDRLSNTCYTWSSREIYK